jgi:hypothetical protein
MKSSALLSAIKDFDGDLKRLQNIVNENVSDLELRDEV